MLMRKEEYEKKVETALDKAPKYLQTYVNTLKMRIDELSEEIKAIGDGDGAIVVNPYSERAPVAFSRERTIKVYLNRGDRNTWLTLYLRDGYLEILGSSGISVAPHSSNHVSIEVD